MAKGNGFKFRLNDEDMPVVRSRMTQEALLRNAGRMRSKQDRKPLEAKRAWKKELHEED